jgi:exodeoxyribonuclease VII large subunit
MNDELAFSVSDFVAVFNQTIEYAYPNVTIVGELSNFRVSKNKWVYFDLKDELASIRFFGTVYMLPGPLEDGLVMQVRGVPRLHPLYGFSITVQSMLPVGEGSLKKAAAMLETKLEKEGLFAPERKRALPYPPQHIGLITSRESAAYADFVKVLQARWSGIVIDFYDTQVQGEAAVGQIASAIAACNAQSQPPEVLVVTRGGGSAEDLAVFNTEQVTRAVAGSRVPTLVAIGHEIDISLAERAADQRASTPSNAAELLVPDRKHEGARLLAIKESLKEALKQQAARLHSEVQHDNQRLEQVIRHHISLQRQELEAKIDLLAALSPEAVLQRGYAILRSGQRVIRSSKGLKQGAAITAELSDGLIKAQVQDVQVK